MFTLINRTVFARTQFRFGNGRKEIVILGSMCPDLPTIGTHLFASSHRFVGAMRFKGIYACTSRST